MISNRKFGVEIEFFGITQEAAVAAVRSAGVECNFAYYGRTTSSPWKMTTDSSIIWGDNRGGLECVSPPLMGEDGLKEVVAVAKALTSAGAKVNKTCGLHVHVEVQDYEVHDFKNLFTRYAKNEGQIDEFMPNSRRRNNQYFCQSVTDIIGNRWFDSANSVNSVIGCFDGKYWKLNPHSFVRLGTVEFRHHSGTTNAEKIENWIRVCVNFVEQSKVVIEANTETKFVAYGTVEYYNTYAMHLIKVATELAPKRYRARENIRNLIRLLSENNYEFSTRQSLTEIAYRCEYSVSTVNVMMSKLRKLGYKIKKVDDYYCNLGFTINTTTTNVVSEAHSKEWSYGLPVDVVSFYQERTEELRG